MPTGHPIVRCRGCGYEAAERAELSLTGLCSECGPRLQREATLQLIEHKGPYFERWRQRCLAAFGSPHIEIPKPVPNVTTFPLRHQTADPGGNA